MGSGQSVTKLTANQKLEKRKIVYPQTNIQRANVHHSESDAVISPVKHSNPSPLKNDPKVYTYQKSSIEANQVIFNESSDKAMQSNIRLERSVPGQHTKRAPITELGTGQHSNAIKQTAQTIKFDMEKFKKANAIGDNNKKESNSFLNRVDHLEVVDGSILNDHDEDLMNEILGEM